MQHFPPKKNDSEEQAPAPASEGAPPAQGENPPADVTAQQEAPGAEEAGMAEQEPAMASQSEEQLAMKAAEVTTNALDELVAIFERRPDLVAPEMITMAQQLLVAAGELASNLQSLNQQPAEGVVPQPETPAGQEGPGQGQQAPQAPAAGGAPQGPPAGVA